MSKISLKVHIKNHLPIQMAENGYRFIKELAAESDIHPNTLYKLERGEEVRISLENVCKLLYAFDCKFEDLFDFEIVSNEPESYDELSDEMKAAIDEARAEYWPDGENAQKAPKPKRRAKPKAVSQNRYKVKRA